MMDRRQFLKTLPTGFIAASSRLSFAAPPERVNTVLGERSSRALGMTLMHEHVLGRLRRRRQGEPSALQR